MRPLSIELDGFFAYRQKTRVDFTGIDYFALEGPTGSGKSSLIDAMVFSLYGKVPRLGGGTIAPAITAGVERARVSFRFGVGGSVFTATRQLERTATGARATEVRLEEGDAVVASGAADVLEAVTGILNLSYEDFTRTVVLPQGEFARFLTATPRERQELLRGLLGLDVYRAMGGLARNREQLARQAADSAAQRLESLDVPDDTQRAAALERLAAIEALSEAIESREGELARLRTALEQETARLEEAVASLRRLQALEEPPRLEELSGMLAGLDDRIATRLEQIESTESELRKLSETLDDLPDVETLDRHDSLRQRLAGVSDDLKSSRLPAIRQDLERAESEVARAREVHEAATARLAETRAGHAAHALARSVVVGDECPVCRRRIERPLELDPTVPLPEVESAERDATLALAVARERVAELTADMARAEAVEERLRLARDELVADLETAPEASEAERVRRIVVAARKGMSEAQGVMEQLRREQSADEERRAALAEEQRSLGKALMAEREKLADLRPAMAESEDVLVQWKELIAWRDAKVTDVESTLVGLRERAASGKVELQAATRRLEDDLVTLGIDVSGSASMAVARAEEQARHLVRDHEKAVAEAAGLAAEVTSAGERAKVAEVMARLLRSDGFERWMMVGAIADLVAGANTILDQLSESSYSLHSDEEGSFQVVDHRNADEVRPIATLSGGEMFLVSLALALSLAETLSAGGGAELDAIILDEGFGSLDEESLDVVASVLENLSAAGLMVGIITHVRALAARAPVRFVVRKGIDGSEIEVID